MQAGPAYGERKPLSHLVMDSSKSTIYELGARNFARFESTHDTSTHRRAFPEENSQ